jgi:beta-phosphoglucomutase
MGAFLKRLKNEGIKTAVASMSPDAREAVRRLRMEPFIDFVVNPEEVIKEAPDPEIFFRAADGLDAFSTDCAAITASLDGVRGIKAAGMFAVGIGADLPQTDWLLADTEGLTYKSLKERFEKRG